MESFISFKSDFYYFILLCFFRFLFFVFTFVMIWSFISSFVCQMLIKYVLIVQIHIANHLNKSYKNVILSTLVYYALLISLFAEELGFIFLQEWACFHQVKSVFIFHCWEVDLGYNFKKVAFIYITIFTNLQMAKESGFQATFI